MNRYTPKIHEKVIHFLHRTTKFLGIAYVYRQVMYFFQYLTRGFSDRQAWSLDITVAKFVIPRLKRLKEIGLGYPMTFNSMIGWHRAIDKMIWSFEYVISDYGSAEYHASNRKRWSIIEAKNMKRFDEGMNLFAKHYKDLWL